MKKTLIHFIIKIALFLLPFLLIVGHYLIKDPYKVLHIYKSYSQRNMEKNTGYIGWQSYLNHRDSIHYNSFLLGNSCTMAYPTHIWNEYLEDAHPIRLFGNSESLYCVHKKTQRIDQLGDSLKNVLLLLDYDILKKTTCPTHYTLVLHPDISKASELSFQLVFLRAFMKPSCLMAYLDFKIFGKYRKYMKGIINTQRVYRNQITNDFINPREKEIKNKKEQYWVDHKKEFPARKQTTVLFPHTIRKKQVKMLTDIMEIFKKHKTNFQIVINPQWSQKQLNPEDLRILKDIFGDDHVHDYSGKNQYSDNKFNFYEKSHYRPKLGKTILENIYRKNRLVSDNSTEKGNSDKL